MTTPSRPAWVDRGLYPFEDRWLEVEGSVVHYVDEGPREAPVLVMAHSNPTWSFLYRGVIAALRADYRCLALDYPGFGLSRPAASYGFTLREHAGAVRAVADAAGADRVTLVGHDWGGPIGIGAFRDQPDRIAAMVFGNTKLWADTSAVARLFGAALSRGLGRRMILERNAYVRRLMPAAFTSRKMTATEHDHYLAPFPTPESRVPIVVSPREIVTGRDFLDEVEATLPALRERPALLLWATKDRATTAKDRERLQRELPCHELVMLDGVGHYLWEEVPERAGAAIRSWAVALQGSAPPPRSRRTPRTSRSGRSPQ